MFCVFLFVLCLFVFFEHNHTPSGKKMLTGIQVVHVTASQVLVQIIGCRWQAISSCP